MLGLLERVIGMWADDKMALRDIETVLRDEGFDISKSAIQRSLQSYESVAGKHKQAMDEAKVLMDTVRDSPNTDLLETVTAIMSGKMLGFAKSIDEVGFDDPGKFIESLSSLARAQTNMGRLRMEYQKGFDAAKKEFFKELSAQLKPEPELLQRLRTIVNQVKAPKKK